MQLLMLLVEALVVAAFLLGAFRARRAVGMTLVGVVIGVMQPLQVLLSSFLYVEPVAGLWMSPGSVVMFTASLMAVLLVYIREDAVGVRKIVYGLLLSNVLVAVLYVLIAWHLRLPGSHDLMGLPAGLFELGARVMVSGTVVLFVDALLLLVLYERLAFLRGAPLARVWLTLAVVVSVDTVLFALLAFAGTGRVTQVMVPGVVGKVALATLYSVLLMVYIRRLDGVGSEERARLDDVFQALTYRERYTLAEARTAEAARRARELRALLLSASADGVLLVGLDGVVEEAGGEGLAALVDHAPLEGVPVSALLPRLELSSSPGRATQELTFHCPSGRTLPVEVVIARSREHAVWAVGVRDISERLALQEQALRSEKMASIGHLAAGIAHDFNNMLTVVQGAAELLLLRGEESKEARVILQATERASELTTQLLTFAGRRVLTPVPTELGAHMARLMPILERVAGEGVQVRMEAAPREVWVLVSPGLLDQVLTNLVANARDAMPDGGAVRVRLREREGRACVEVEDNGGGIDPEVLPHIFDPYFTTKGEGRGTGLGLATSAGFIEQSGGSIEVESAPGAGATFRVSLPLFAGHAAAGGSAESAAASP